MDISLQALILPHVLPFWLKMSTKVAARHRQLHFPELFIHDGTGFRVCSKNYRLGYTSLGPYSFTMGIHLCDGHKSNSHRFSSQW